MGYCRSIKGVGERARMLYMVTREPKKKRKIQYGSKQGEKKQDESSSTMSVYKCEVTGGL